MQKPAPLAFWFAAGSQHLYGPEALAQVAANSRAVAEGLDASGRLAAPVLWKPTLKSSDEIQAFMEAATADATCAGVIVWMHTFSPSKMWIRGLHALKKPLLHLHTQHGRDLPWATIDMDFMNLHQAAHGDREFAHITARMKTPRAVVSGHWQDANVQERVGRWSRAARAVSEGRRAKVVRFGDNMREVAVTEGDKVAAQSVLGWSVNTLGVGGLVERVKATDPAAVKTLVETYRAEYEIDAALLGDDRQRHRIEVQASYELAIESILVEGGYGAFTTNFEDLWGMEQLPGLAVQRLMAKGYGFAGEGDWKTAALVRAMKTMGRGLPGGTSFMEDYTYHMDPASPLVLGSHMLEVCPTIAAGKPRLEIHPLGIGGKDDPARLVFDAAPGRAVNATLVEFGDRFRLLVNEVESTGVPRPMPKLPVARCVWKALPDFTTALEGWLWSGGAHHTGYSTQVPTETLRMYADLLGLEWIRIGEGTDLDNVRLQLATQELLAKTGIRA